MASDTRERLVLAAQRLFWERGYASTSVADVLAAAGVGSGSLYHFFDGKESLLRAVLEWYIGALWPHVIQPAFDATADPVERVFAIMAGYRAMLIETNFRHGCPIGNLALELTGEHPEARALIAQNFTNWTAAVQLCIEAASPTFAHSVDARALSVFVLTTMEGAVMLGRAYRALDAYDAAVAQLRVHFDLLRGRAPAPEGPRSAADSVESVDGAGQA